MVFWVGVGDIRPCIRRDKSGGIRFDPIATHKGATLSATIADRWRWFSSMKGPASAKCFGGFWTTQLILLLLLALDVLVIVLVVAVNLCCGEMHYL